MPDKHGYEWGVGRRKTSVARVRIRKGTGKCTVNRRDYKEYFPHQRLQMLARRLEQLGTARAQRDRGAVAQQRCGAGGADAAGTSRDQRAPARERQLARSCGMSLRRGRHRASSSLAGRAYCRGMIAPAPGGGKRHGRLALQRAHMRQHWRSSRREVRLQADIDSINVRQACRLRVSG